MTMSATLDFKKNSSFFCQKVISLKSLIFKIYFGPKRCVGVEISKKIGVSRITMAKYLRVFAAEGLLRQKNIGNLTLWFLESGQENYYLTWIYFIAVFSPGLIVSPILSILQGFDKIKEVQSIIFLPCNIVAHPAICCMIPGLR